MKLEWLQQLRIRSAQWVDRFYHYVIRKYES